MKQLGTKEEWKRTRRKVGMEFLGTILHVGTDFMVHAPMKVAKDTLTNDKKSNDGGNGGECSKLNDPTEPRNCGAHYGFGRKPSFTA